MSDCLLTGCDKSLEDLLPWWISRIRKHMPLALIKVADFGMSERAHAYLRDNDIELLVLDKQGFRKAGWHLKPLSIITCLEQPDADRVCWLDIDCEVQKPIEEIFDFAVDEKLGLTKDPFGGKRAFWATGVIVVKNNSTILKDWNTRCQRATDRGDQEALFGMIRNSANLISEMPMEYQWLRLHIKRGIDNPDKKIMHWTGRPGKIMIRGFIKKHPSLQVLN